MPAGGNYHTASVSRFVLAELKKYGIFKAPYSANYKQVIEHGSDG